MKRRAFIAHLRLNGCQLIREGARHWWGNPASGARSAVPRHFEVSDLLCKKICRDLGIPSP
ncbi:MAG: addiction module toxin, HicA family [Actinobacteria bacterium]|nr:addiction module toxin, HicA family [Actinomycetota bacterium]